MGVLMLELILPLATESDFPFTVAAAATDTVAEADRGPAAERADDPKRRRRPNRLAVSPQNRAMSIAVRTVRREIRASLRPLNEFGALLVSEWVCWTGSEDIYSLFDLVGLAMSLVYDSTPYKESPQFRLNEKCKVGDKNLLELNLIK